MSGNSTLVVPLAVLALLAGLSAWIERTVRLPPTAIQTGKSEPETIIENFRARETGVDGRLRYRLEATTLRHYSGSTPARATELVAPRFTQQSPDGTQTDARARRATLSADGKTFTLSGDAQVARRAAAGSRDGSFVLRTAELDIHPETESFSAPGPVEFENGGLRARAGRMEWRGQSRVAELTGRVRAVYR
jgi:lipopolysaccharide export system protein LptC